MDVWFKGRQLTALLDYRKTSVDRQVAKVKKTLSEINFLLVENHKRYNSINQEIQSLTPFGVFHRCDIYKNIRRQGVLLSQQQQVSHQIKLLEEDKEKTELELKEFYKVRSTLEKKIYKFFGYFHKRHMEFIIRCENNTENELHETISYGRAKH